MRLRQWFAVHTKARAEEQAAAALKAKEIPVYLPMIGVRRVNPRARPVAPLFPGYLFVHVDLEEVGESAINWAPGVVRLVGFGNGPIAVPDAVVEHVKRRVAEIQARGGWGPASLRRGDTVRIASGPLSALDGVFEGHLSARGRARVLVEFLGRLTTAEVDVNALERQHV